MSRILVTGANGFIGSHLVVLLIRESKEDDEILCMVRHTSDLSNILELLEKPNVRIVIGDVTKPETLPNAVRRANYIFHLAAALKIPEDKRYFEVNTRGTENMLTAALEYAADTLKRFVLVSSQAAAGPSPGKILIDEDKEGKPVGAYGRSKLQAEKIAEGYMDKLPITIVRPSAVYGAREKDLTQTIPAVESRIHLKIGFTKRYASFINAVDLVRGIVNASQSEKAMGQTYFLTDKDYYSDIQLVKTMAKAMDKSWGILVPIPKISLILFSLLSTIKYWFFRGRPGMVLNMVKNITQKYWLCSPDKAKKDFDWEAKISLIDGMKKTLEDYRKQKRIIRVMPDEGKKLILAKYFFLTLIVGAIVEFLSVSGRVFYYEPWWMIFPVTLGLWGIIFALVANITRVYKLLGQFLLGFVVGFAITYFDFLFTHFKLFPDDQFLGISNPLWRTTLLATGAASVILLINFLMREFYKHKLRLG